MMRSIGRLIAFVFALQPFAVLAQPLCEMSEIEAVTSPQCVRWYFACMLGDAVLGEPSARFASMPYKTRQKFAVEATFAVAEERCERFDYSEANDAVAAKLRALDIE